MFVSLALAGCTSTSYETRPFYQKELDSETHGKKTVLDRIVETDPGTFTVNVSPEYFKEPPARVAVLPFADAGSANFVVDKIPITFRNRQQRFDWAWTDAQRLRRAFEGYLAQREFEVMPLVAVDAVLRERGIDTPEKLYRIAPNELGRMLGVDAVVYGTVLHYESYYFLLVAGWEVATQVSIVSTHDDGELVEANGGRFSLQVTPALTPEDILINSGVNLLELRDIILARAEEETCREIVHRIPVSRQLEERLQEAALSQAEEADPVQPAAQVDVRAVRLDRNVETGH
jgi:putative lipoprotein DUF799